MFISIGGCRFEFVAENLVLPEPGPNHWLYDRYVLDSNAYDIQEEFTVIVTCRTLPDISGYTKIFDSVFTWKCYKKGGEYLILQPDPKTGQPLVISKFQEKERIITVFCSDAYRDLLENGSALHPFSYPLDQVVMSFILADQGGGIVHSSGWLHDDEAWIFPGKSGAGKSTISHLIKEVTGEPLFSDDRMIIRQEGEKYRAYGTPWAGDENDALNRSAQLRGLFFLHQGSENRIRKIAPIDGFRRLMAVMTVPWYDKDRVTKMMDFSDDLLKTIPVYEFSFLNDKSAVEELLSGAHSEIL